MEEEYVNKIKDLKRQLNQTSSDKRKRDLNKCIYKMQTELRYYKQQRRLVNG